MMATEPSIINPADVSASPEPRPQTLDANQNVDLELPAVNGALAPNEDIANKHITSVEDQVNSADVSVSGGSDTEATRLRDGDDKGHGRTGSSAKKPATFKAVSVNKTFLASKANPNSATSKTADNKPAAGSSTPPTGAASLLVSRPRLIAKTGSGTRDSLPRFSSTINGGKPASAPDPSVVWNKNQPVPPREPKKFTDEELKKYGIHMASRLNEDDAQGQNKWADIDDDDDDWAPDAITWGDGTKTTLPHPDEQPPPVTSNVYVASKGTGQPVLSQHGMGQSGMGQHVMGQHGMSQHGIGQHGMGQHVMSQHGIGQHGMGQHIMSAPGAGQPGVSQLEKPTSPAPSGSLSSLMTKSSGLAAGRGLVLKPASQEKPALVAKPPAPPATAKSPWATLPQVDKSSPVSANSSHLSRPPPHDLSSMKGSMAPPPKEIAADDFNRSTWRDSTAHGNRELYNSHSGRYEPAPDRRGSMRADQQPKHPALMQRPHGSDHPAEPSSAFQTTRTSQEAPFGRRRASSNVSGGSGTFFQRMGKGNDGYMGGPPEMPGLRRGSMAGSVESPVSPNSIHGQPRQQSWMPRPSPGTSHAIPYQGAPSSDGNVVSPPPAQPAQPVDDDIEYQKKTMREKVELARKRRQDEEAREEADRRERIQKKLDALGPAPEKKSEKKETPPKTEPVKPVQIQQREQPDSASTTTPIMSPVQEVAKKDASVNPNAAENNPKAGPPNRSLPPGPASRRMSHGQEGKQPQVWGGPGPRPERFQVWGPGGPPPSRNVWGSPDNDRGLGNGTFDPDLGLLAGSTAAAAPSAPGGKGPAPIAPPSSARPAAPQGRSQPPVPIGSRAARYGAPGSDLASKWVASVADNDKKISEARLAERVSRERQLAERGLTMEDAQPIIKETWRPVQVPGDGSRRPMATAEVQSHHPSSWKASREELAHGVAPVDASLPSATAGVIGAGSGSVLSQANQAASSQHRPSRFFPPKDARAETSAATDRSRPTSPSPPPPTMEGHPVYEGDVTHPHVSLPRPYPVVRLPPAMRGLQSSQHNPAAGWATRGSNRDATRAPTRQGQAAAQGGESSKGPKGNWQDKINSLLNGGKPSPPKSLGVDPASRSAMDHAPLLDSATVSLPSVAPRSLPKTRGHGHNQGHNPVQGRREPISKPMAEECFEEQEMGSLPLIRLPLVTPVAAWQPALPPAKPLPKKFIVEPCIMDPFYFSSDISGGSGNGNGNGNGNGGKNGMKIQLPGMAEAKVVALPPSASRGGGNGGNGGGERGSHGGRPAPRNRGSGHGPRGAKREASHSHGEAGGAAGAGAGAGNLGRSGRGGYRSRASDNWSRHSATPQPQPQPSLPA